MPWIGASLRRDGAAQVVVAAVILRRRNQSASQAKWQSHCSGFPDKSLQYGKYGYTFELRWVKY